MRKADINGGHGFSNAGYSQELSLKVNCYNYVELHGMDAISG